MLAKKIPMRMCVACRQMKPKPELIRVVRTPEGEVHAGVGDHTAVQGSLAVTGKINGRGAYICNDIACVEKAEKTGALARALDTAVDKAVYESLKKGCEGLEK